MRFIGDMKIEFAVASPDLWNRRQDSGRSGFEIIQGICGMPPMLPADARRIPGWRVLKDYISCGRLFIARNWSVLISSMQSLLCDRERPEDAASEPHHLTHAPEALRYAVMSRFELEKEEDPLPFRFGRKSEMGRAIWDI